MIGKLLRRRPAPAAQVGGVDSNLLLSRWGDEQAASRQGQATSRLFGPSSVMLLRDKLRPLATADRWTTRLGWLGALAGLLLALALFAPASWLARGVAAATDQRVVLAQARGTLWSGDAVLVLTAGRGSLDARALPGRISWRLRPAWQAGPAARVTLQQDCCIPMPVDLLLQAGWNRWQLSLPAPQSGGAWRAHWPGELLNGLGTPFNTMDLRGQLRLSSTGLSFSQVEGRFIVQGSVDVEMRDMSSRVSTLRTLGSYRLRIDGGGLAAPTRLSLSTLEGALQLTGSGEWTVQGVRFRGEATARPAEEAALSNLLNIIGRRDGARSILSIG